LNAILFETWFSVEFRPSRLSWDERKYINNDIYILLFTNHQRINSNMKGLMYCLYHEKVSHLFARSYLDYVVYYDAKWKWSSVPSMVMLYFNCNIFIYIIIFLWNLKSSHSALNSMHIYWFRIIQSTLQNGSGVRYGNIIFNCNIFLYIILFFM